MNTLCISTNLTSAEWAAWVQAVGSIVAILGAVWTAGWQTRKQHQSGLALQAAQQHQFQAELAKTLSVFARNCSQAVAFLSAQLKDREAVYQIAEGHVHFDLGELSKQDAALAAIPLYSFPSALVTPTMLLSATVRQFREKVEMVLRVDRSMDARAFEDFFQVLRQINESLRATCGDIAKEVERMQHGAAPN